MVDLWDCFLCLTEVETEPQRDLVTYTGSLSEEEVEPQFAPRQLGAKSFAFLYSSAAPSPTPGDLPDPATEPGSHASPISAGRFFTTSSTCEATVHVCEFYKNAATLSVLICLLLLYLTLRF